MQKQEIELVKNDCERMAHINLVQKIHRKLAGEIQ